MGMMLVMTMTMVVMMMMMTSSDDDNDSSGDRPPTPLWKHHSALSTSILTLKNQPGIAPVLQYLDKWSPLCFRQMFSAVVSALDESIGRIVQVGFGPS